MATHGRSCSIERPGALEREPKVQGRLETRCELTDGQDWSRGRPTRARNGKRRTTTLEQGSANVSDEHRAVERGGKVSATSHDGDEARQAAHRGWNALRWRDCCGLDLGGDLASFDAAAGARVELRDFGAAGEYLKGQSRAEGGIAHAKRARLLRSDSCPGRTRGGRRV